VSSTKRPKQMLYRDLDVSTFVLKPAENVGKNGSKVIYMNEDLMVQTPRCRLPFDPFSNSFTINLNEPFYHLIRGIEDYILKQANLRSTEWFGRELSVEEIKSMFKSSITESDKGYLPSMKIPYNEECEFYESDNMTIAPKDKLIKGSEVRLILTFPKVNIKKRCGVTTFNICIELYQLKFVTKREVCPQTFSFLD
jgi:hypothetical protein